MMWFRKPKPRLTDDQIAAAAARWLARYAARNRADVTKLLIRERCVELRRGPVSPIASRDSVVAPVRALREVRG